MVVDERRRHEMYLELERVLGRKAADALMEHLPPTGWADVATKQDLETLRVATKQDLHALREVMDARFDSLRDSILGQLYRSQRNVVISLVGIIAVLNGIMFTALRAL